MTGPTAEAVTQDKTEKLARELQAQMRAAMEATPGSKAMLAFLPVLNLCDHILSGDMRREIENAAYRRANSLVLKQCGTEGDHADNALCAASDAIVALIQPAAQKEDWK